MYLYYTLIHRTCIHVPLLNGKQPLYTSYQMVYLVCLVVQLNLLITLVVKGHDYGLSLYVVSI